MHSDKMPIARARGYCAVCRAQARSQRAGTLVSMRTSALRASSRSSPDGAVLDKILELEVALVILEAVVPAEHEVEQ